MNKRNTIKLTSITALAAMLLSVVFSGSAIAGPGKGPQSSAAVFTVCKIDEANGEIDVSILLTDKSSGAAKAVLETVEIEGLQKEKGRNWNTLGSMWTNAETCMDEYGNDIGPIEIGKTCHVSLDICAGLDADVSKSLNAETTLTLTGSSSKDKYTSKCKDDPATDDGDPTTDWDNEAIMKIANHPTLCK